jgi:hypothetical protein
VLGHECLARPTHWNAKGKRIQHQAHQEEKKYQNQNSATPEIFFLLGDLGDLGVESSFF